MAAWSTIASHSEPVPITSNPNTAPTIAVLVAGEREERHSEHQLAEELEQQQPRTHAHEGHVLGDGRELGRRPNTDADLIEEDVANDPGHEVDQKRDAGEPRVGPESHLRGPLTLRDRRRPQRLSRP